MPYNTDSQICEILSVIFIFRASTNLWSEWILPSSFRSTFTACGTYKLYAIFWQWRKAGVILFAALHRNPDCDAFVWMQARDIDGVESRGWDVFHTVVSGVCPEQSRRHRHHQQGLLLTFVSMCLCMCVYVRTRIHIYVRRLVAWWAIAFPSEKKQLAKLKAIIQK